MTRYLSFILLLAALVSTGVAQEPKPAGVVPTAELKAVVPSSYFYRGQAASVELRNSAAVRTKAGKYFLAGLVDASGYASDVASKYQGFFITEVKLRVGEAELAPGEYGFGFVGDKFLVTDVGANDVFSTASQRDDNMKRPMPLKIAADGDHYRLYAGRKYVTVQVE